MKKKQETEGDRRNDSVEEEEFEIEGKNSDTYLQRKKGK